MVKISKETLQKLLDNFYEACNLADEMDIYEWEEGDETIQEMKEWTEAQRYTIKTTLPNLFW